ncbi:MAG TPA: hypothetical protein VGM76_08110 [Lacipirellulaceae bacterium]|jgi:hypothetical protein
MVARLAAQNWWGEVVGPHGSGKSTLLATLAPRISAAGLSATSIALRNHEGHLPWQVLRRALSLPHPVVIVDGYEQLSQFSRAALRWRCRRSAAGLLVTSHAATGLPLLAQLQPDLLLVEQLVAELTQCRPAAISPTDVAASHACRGSNVRELFFDLYDRHEVACRAIRTRTESVA